MNDNSSSQVEVNKIQIFTLIFVLIISFFCCVIAALNPDKFIYVLIPSKIAVLSLSIMGLICIPYLLYYYVNILKNKECLKVDKKGIYNGCSFLNKKQINWNEITDIDTLKYQGIYRIRIQVLENEKYLTNLNIISKYIANRTISELKTPIIIDCANLNCTFEELKTMIFENWKNNK